MDAPPPSLLNAMRSASARGMKIMRPVNHAYYADVSFS